MYEFADLRREPCGARAAGREREGGADHGLCEAVRYRDRGRTEQERAEKGGEPDPAPRERVAEPPAAQFEALFERGQRAPQALGRLVPARTLERAEYQRRTKHLGQREQLLVERREQLAPGHFVERVRRGSGRAALLAPRPPGRGPAGLERQQVGGPVQPVRDRRLPPAARRLPGQEQKCGLEHVLRVLAAAEHPVPGGEHHRPVAAHERFERGLVPPVGEPLKQLPVRAPDLRVLPDEPPHALPVDPDAWHR